MNSRLNRLQPYPFEKLRELFADLTPARQHSPIMLSIGEPRHPAPAFVLQTLADNLHLLANYPATRGQEGLRHSIAHWLQRRFHLESVDPERQVLPVNGTREALFAFAQAVVEPTSDALVCMPNPFYQIYEGAALCAGATPLFINCTAETGFLPDFTAISEDQWQRCQLLYLCSPGNPSGAVLPLTTLQHLIGLAREHDFIIASDECYAEIYLDEANPPPGLLQACAAEGDSSYQNCVVFHSLSKRSNLPGLRSGFVAGDARVLADFLTYRTYHGCAMPLHHQLASIAAWDDETHVSENRQRYREKFAAVLDILQPQMKVTKPEAGFYLWPETPIADTELARLLYRDEHLTALPGSFLAREAGGINPGARRLRLALVAEHDECVTAARRISRCLQKL